MHGHCFPMKASFTAPNLVLTLHGPRTMGAGLKQVDTIVGRTHIANVSIHGSKGLLFLQRSERTASVDSWPSSWIPDWLLANPIITTQKQSQTQTVPPHSEPKRLACSQGFSPVPSYKRGKPGSVHADSKNVGTNPPLTSGRGPEDTVLACHPSLPPSPTSP